MEALGAIELDPGATANILVLPCPIQILDRLDTFQLRISSFVGHTFLAHYIQKLVLSSLVTIFFNQAFFK